MTEGVKALVMDRTAEYGGDWGVNHAKRLIAMVETLGAGTDYDRDTVWMAAYLHDWGGYGKWMVNGVDHADRSVEVVGGFLAEQGVTGPIAEGILDCIRYHHRGPEAQRPESILLADADALDFLGVTGVLRDFSKTPRDLRKAYATSRQRMASLPGMLRTEKAKDLAEERVAVMKALFGDFEAETAGVF